MVTRRIIAGPHSGLAAQMRCVIRDAGQWEGFWSLAASPNLRRPEMPNFSRSIVVAASAGESPSTGYAITIEKAIKVEGGIVVVVKKTGPQAGAVVFYEVTYPIDVVAIDAAPGTPIHFAEQ